MISRRRWRGAWAWLSTSSLKERRLSHTNEILHPNEVRSLWRSLWSGRLQTPKIRKPLYIMLTPTMSIQLSSVDIKQRPSQRRFHCQSNNIRNRQQHNQQGRSQLLKPTQLWQQRLPQQPQFTIHDDVGGLGAVTSAQITFHTAKKEAPISEDNIMEHWRSPAS